MCEFFAINSEIFKRMIFSFVFKVFKTKMFVFFLLSIDRSGFFFRWMFFVNSSKPRKQAHSGSNSNQRLGILVL